MIYGYARCSTSESKQDINRQIKELKAAGADEVIFEYEHGDAKTKKQLQMLLDIAKEGDTIITLEVSRLSRSTQQLCELIEIIRAKHLRLVIVGSITIDCRNGQTDPMSEAFLWERVKKSINVYGKTPHCFRHTFATRAHRAGVDDKTLQTMGGWKDLATMKNIYVHTQDEDLEIARKILTSSTP